jgi:hypothetical protein
MHCKAEVRRAPRPKPAATTWAAADGRLARLDPWQGASSRRAGADRIVRPGCSNDVFHHAARGRRASPVSHRDPTDYAQGL